MTKALLLNSGGYDSHVCLHLGYALGYDPFSLFFNYGQKTLDKERQCVKKSIENIHEVGFHHAKFFRELTLNVSWILNYEQSNYFPMRNLIFLSHALSFAEAKNYNMIIMGIVASSNPYSDTTNEFISHMQDICRSVNVELWCPLQEIGKGDVYDLGNKLGVKIEDTWSCDYSSDIPCGKCGACEDIKLGIKHGYIPEQKFSV